MIRLVVADDVPVFREMVVCALELEDDLEVVGQASNGADAVEACRRHQPDVIILDVEMPRMNGVEATRQIVANCPKTRVVILTAFEDDGLILQLIQAGATGYLLKESKTNEVIRAIRTAYGGESLIDPKVAQKMMRMMMGMSAQPAPPPKNGAEEKLEQLTSREREVLREIGRGRNNKELAEICQIGGNTVKTHVARIMQKLDVRDRVELVLLAVQAGLVEE
ncbi:MAG: response regulator transcription factor [Candidatus Eremiobacteraeota bacterium]|nr:response regulator transcription factor [Candidatus Eremiobacteraeota bacterium]MCW5871355.1 response regulator transcription factor [Candidatus Eremiobacteraeota bacterium]